MRGVDLERYRFDTDLTFAALTMHPDGRVYHRYGARDERAADVWLSLESFAAVLGASVTDHAAALAGPTPEAPSSIEGGASERGGALEDLPAFQKRDKGECIHCHSVLPALYEEELAAGTWSAGKLWRFPPPSRLGLDLQRDEQTRIHAVAAGSFAAAAGLAVGDELLTVGAQSIASISDLMFALDEFPQEGGELSLRYRRAAEQRTTQLTLPAGWKVGTPLSFSWRPFKWGFAPAPGFGGGQLGEARLRRFGLIDAPSEPGKPSPESALPFAFQVEYLVTWGDNRRFGASAESAGLRKGDIVTRIAGRNDFASVDHFHAWWRLTRKPGDVVELEILRGQERQLLRLQVVK